MKSRNVRAILAVVAGLALFAATAYAESKNSGNVAITLGVSAYMDVQAGDITTWYRGVDGNGVPNFAGPGLGDDPEFTNATPGGGEVWPYNGTFDYASGAAGRSVVTVKSNVPCTIKLKPSPGSGNEWPQLKLVGGTPSQLLQGHMALVYPSGGHLKPFSSRAWALSPGDSTSTWLYALVERKGLDDRAGTYTGKIVLQIWNDTP